jgi:hypothetical protein
VAGGGKTVSLAAAESVRVTRRDKASIVACLIAVLADAVTIARPSAPGRHCGQRREHRRQRPKLNVFA